MNSYQWTWCCEVLYFLRNRICQQSNCISYRHVHWKRHSFLICPTYRCVIQLITREVGKRYRDGCFKLYMEDKGCNFHTITRGLLRIKGKILILHVYPKILVEQWFITNLSNDLKFKGIGFILFLKNGLKKNLQIKTIKKIFSEVIIMRYVELWHVVPEIS
jgi:hypothetical protein